jgi:hypothetical protein
MPRMGSGGAYERRDGDARGAGAGVGKGRRGGCGLRWCSSPGGVGRRACRRRRAPRRARARLLDALKEALARRGRGARRGRELLRQRRQPRGRGRHGAWLARGGLAGRASVRPPRAAGAGGAAGCARRAPRGAGVGQPRGRPPRRVGACPRPAVPPDMAAVGRGLHSSLSTAFVAAGVARGPRSWAARGAEGRCLAGSRDRDDCVWRDREAGGWFLGGPRAGHREIWGGCAAAAAHLYTGRPQWHARGLAHSRAGARRGDRDDGRGARRGQTARPAPPHCAVPIAAPQTRQDAIAAHQGSSLHHPRIASRCVAATAAAASTSAAACTDASARARRARTRVATTAQQTGRSQRTAAAARRERRAASPRPPPCPPAPRPLPPRRTRRCMQRATPD